MGTDRLKYRCVIYDEVKDIQYFYELPYNKDTVFVCTYLEGNQGFYARKSQLLQCTGLKDKNGKLIYEGDIILLEDITFVATFHDEYDSNYGRVEFVKDIGFKQPLTYIPTVAHQSEIIGNIYENPELLDK